MKPASRKKIPLAYQPKILLKIVMADNLEKRIEAIEARNKKVEADKAWELSWARRIIIMALIYIVVGVYLRFVVHISPWINGLVPVIGYALSTVTIQRLKQWWISKQ